MTSSSVLDIFQWLDVGQSSRVFVANIKSAYQQPTQSLRVLRGIFELSGVVRKVKMYKDSSSTDSKCACVVYYCTKQAAHRAVRELQGTMFNKSPLFLKPDMRKDPPDWTSRLWVGYLTAQANDLFGHSGWSSELKAVDTGDQGQVTAEVAIHVFGSEYVKVESSSPGILSVTSRHTELPDPDDESRNAILCRIAKEKATVKAFEMIKAVRIQIKDQKKLVVYPLQQEYN